MRIIEIRPSKKFKGAWVAFEEPGVKPAFQDKASAPEYAKTRFGGAAGEIHVHDEAGENIVGNISMDGRGKYPHSE